jgi:hypothetical protein
LGLEPFLVKIAVGFDSVFMLSKFVGNAKRHTFKRSNAVAEEVYKGIASQSTVGVRRK